MVGFPLLLLSQAVPVAEFFQFDAFSRCIEMFVRFCKLSRLFHQHTIALWFCFGVQNRRDRALCGQFFVTYATPECPPWPNFFNVMLFKVLSRCLCSFANFLDLLINKQSLFDAVFRFKTDHILGQFEVRLSLILTVVRPGCRSFWSLKLLLLQDNFKNLANFVCAKFGTPTHRFG